MIFPSQTLLRFFRAVFIIIATFYLVLPTHSFPLKPPDSIQSLEQADTETPWRRAYFTNYTREQARNHYRRQIGRSSLFGLPMPTVLLNYPPEDAFTLIRDQTRGTGLEEVLQPFRESLFIDYFEPKDPKDAVVYRGIPFFQKITIKYTASSVFVRVPIAFAALFSFWFLVKEINQTFFNIFTKCFSK